MNHKKIPLAGPWITEKEKKYVLDAVATAWYSDAYKYIKLFEKKFSEYIGMKYAVALPSCTSAIHLSLLALNIKVGDEVIVPDITWIATAAPIKYVNATPVFADIDKKTWCLSSESIKKCITKKTKAIITVDLYGSVPEMDEIIELAKKHNIHVIEDAAEAIGSEYKGKKAGCLGDIGVFSFHGSKTLTTGEGGILVTNSEKIYKRVMILADHGRHPGEKKQFWSQEIAHKYKISDLQAALGLAQLERIDELVKRKISIFEKYKSVLLNVRGVTLNPELPNIKNSFWMVSAVLDPSLGIEKETIIELMKKENIDVRPFFYPLSSTPPYEKTREGRKAQKRNRVSYDLHKYGINLPSGLEITDSEINYVCNVFKKIILNKN